MKEEIFESVLNEILEELKQATQVIKEWQTTLTALTEKVAAFDQRLNEGVVAPPADTLAVQKVIEEGLAKIEQRILDSASKTNQTLTETFQKTTAIVEAQPKAIVRQVRFQFFPEHDYNGSFKYFVRWAVLAMTILVVVTALVALGSKWINNIHIERLNNPPSAPTGFHKSFPSSLPAASSAHPTPSFTHPASSPRPPSPHHTHPLLTHSSDSLPDSTSLSGKPGN